jgi:hypothetical protein
MANPWRSPDRAKSNAFPEPGSRSQPTLIRATPITNPIIMCDEEAIASLFSQWTGLAHVQFGLTYLICNENDRQGRKT